MKTVGSRAEVWHGTAEHTTGGLKKKDLYMGKDEHIHAKKMKKRGGEDPLKKWRAAVKKARKNIGSEGFVALAKGGDLYKEAKKIYNK